MRPLFTLFNFRFRSEILHETVPNDEKFEKEWFLGDTNTAEQLLLYRSAARQRPYLLGSVFVQTILLFISIIYLIILQRSSDIACARQLSPYSPFLTTEGLKYEEFMERNHLMQPSEYRGRPTHEVEQAWIHLWKVPPIKFPEEKLELLQKTPPALYKHVASEYGDGVKGFLDVFHQLHCLNMIRQYTYREDWDYSNVTAFRAPDEVVRGHVDHCIETVRKGIMCASDVTPVVFLESTGKPEFNVQRKCRNFWDIHKWSTQNLAF